jgi:GT2 family glycosyltransferase
LIEFVSATRMTQEEFWRSSALGQSLLRLGSDERLARAHIAYENKRGVPDVYNEQLAADDGSDILVFIHDDVWIDDFFIADRLLEGMQKYDVLGVAGTPRQLPGQYGFAVMDPASAPHAKGNLSGAIAHGEGPFGPVTRLGPVPADCVFLDGVFLAVRKSALRRMGVQFDPRFDFHFYDVDFCRAAHEGDARIGTWPICLTHQGSGAGYDSPGWKANLRTYRRKWGD